MQYQGSGREQLLCISLRRHREITLTNVVCKIPEQIINKQMGDYLQSNYQSERQHGVRERRLCITNLLDFYERENSFRDQRDGWGDCLFLDCQTAFDTTAQEAAKEALFIDWHNGETPSMDRILSSWMGVQDACQRSSLEMGWGYQWRAVASHERSKELRRSYQLTNGLISSPMLV